jgi:hypothetical protein
MKKEACMTTGKKDVRLASNQLRTGKTKAQRSVAGSDLAQAKRGTGKSGGSRRVGRK